MNVKSKVSNIVKTTKLSYKIYKSIELCGRSERSNPALGRGISFINTLEGWNMNCHLYRTHTYYLTRTIFDSLPAAVQDLFKHSPQSGEMKQRVELWKEVLKPMDNKEYHKAIGFICADYRRIKALKYEVN